MLINITVTVTEKDIKNGKKDNCTLCPIAKAVRRVFSELKIKGTPYVETETIGIHRNDDRDYTVNLPKKARAFIAYYDDEETEQQAIRAKAKPFSFKISIPQKAFQPIKSA